MQQSDGARSAFTLSVVHQRKDQRRVTAVALLKAGQRVFLGLDNGVVEEHRCSSSSSTQAVYGGAGGLCALQTLQGHQGLWGCPQSAWQHRTGETAAGRHS